jgi:hypothetical protein
MANGADKASIGDVVANLTRDISSLVRKEIDLARAEMGAKVGNAQKGLMSVIGGSLIALAALVILLQALVLGLENAGLDTWLAALIVGVVVTLAGLIVAMRGASTLQKNIDPTPYRTSQSVRDDAGMVKEKVR